jgi:hypothetical protein
MKNLRALLLALLAVATVTAAHAQINVGISVKRRLFIYGEPIIATVTVTNLTGRDITLADTPGLQWFGFQISGANDRFIPPRDPNYKVPALDVRSGETVKRTVNLNELYEMGDFGIYTIKGAIYHAEMKRYFTSKSDHVEVTEGTVIQRQTVGVPDGRQGSGGTRTFTLLSHLVDKQKTLYLRCEDAETGTIFCTYALGRMIDGVPAQIANDKMNDMYVLNFVGARTYLLTKVGTNGEFFSQTTYTAPKTRPTLRKLSDGTLQIIGGKKEDPIAQNPGTEQPVPKLSDRPAGLPR